WRSSPAMGGITTKIAALPATLLRTSSECKRSDSRAAAILRGRLEIPAEKCSYRQKLQRDLRMRSREMQAANGSCVPLVPASLHLQSCSDSCARYIRRAWDSCGESDDL